MVTFDTKELVAYIQKERDRVSLNFANQCAPIVLASKPAILMMVPIEDRVGYEKKAASFELTTTSLYYGKNRIAMLFYRTQRLSNLLDSTKTKEFLFAKGYQRIDLEEVLLELGKRIGAYYEKGTEYPHELGVILGYPILDVIGYVKNQGKACSYSGYWKVYDNVTYAKQVFFEYDQARQTMLSEIFRETFYRNSLT